VTTRFAEAEVVAPVLVFLMLQFCGGSNDGDDHYDMRQYFVTISAPTNSIFQAPAAAQLSARASLDLRSFAHCAGQF
jgi:hypothetical protein